MNLVNSPQLCQLIRERGRESKIPRDVPSPVHAQRVIDNNISSQAMAGNLMEGN